MTRAAAAAREPLSTDGSRLKVLDLGTQVAGPFVATLLGDLGADVIKVEQPETGDPVRLPDGLSARWQVDGRNKRSITLNLRVPEGQALLRRLVGWADILVENFRPGTMARWGLGYDELAKVNPGLVMVSISGYGQEGPRAQLPGYDHTGAAFGGLTYLTGPGDRPPTLPGLSTVDYTTGMMATIGALEAVRRRDRQGSAGKGEWVQCALYESVLRMEGPEFVNFSRTRAVRERCGGRPTEKSAGSPQSFTYLTKDDKWIASNPVSDAQFGRLAKLLKAPRLQSPDFATRAARFAHAGELYAIFSDWVRSHDRSEVLRQLEMADLPASPVNSVADIAQDPHVRARQDLVTVVNAKGEEVMMPNVFPRLQRNPGAIRWSGEPLGHSNEEVYLGLLGLQRVEYESLKEQNIV